MADAASLDIAVDSGEPPERKLMPAAINNNDNDDAHDKTDEDDNTPPTRSKVANREGSTELTDFEDYKSDSSKSEEEQLAEGDLEDSDPEMKVECPSTGGAVLNACTGDHLYVY